MKVLDLFSGLGGWSQAFKDRGHTVVTLDLEEKFNTTICKDIMEVTVADFAEWLPFDVVLASPPCNCFSCLTIRYYWNKDKTPKNKKTLNAIEVVKKTLSLIDELNPKFWVIENPRGMLRLQSFMKKHHRKTVTYCQYGEKYQKPTDLWGHFPMAFKAKKCSANSKCHIKTKRGDRNFSTGGIKDNGTPEKRAMIPYGLSKEFCLACENPTHIRSLLFVSPRVAQENK